MTVTTRHADWLTVIRRYLIAVAAGNLVWEIAQMPLYTLWETGTARDILQAALHCTVGDILIATVTLIAALTIAGSPGWPHRRFAQVSGGTVLLGVLYTVYSEYRNTIVLHNWTYAAAMPLLPWLGTGAAPLAQWLFIPLLALAWSGRTVRAQQTGSQQCTE